jgi:hypothetical protein
LGNWGQVNLIACRFYKKPVHLLKPAQDTHADPRIALSGERVIAAEEVGAFLRKPDPQSSFMERAIARHAAGLGEHLPLWKDKALRWRIINNYVISDVLCGVQGGLPGRSAESGYSRHDFEADMLDPQLSQGVEAIISLP